MHGIIASFHGWGFFPKSIFAKDLLSSLFLFIAPNWHNLKNNPSLFELFLINLIVLSITLVKFSQDPTQKPALLWCLLFLLLFLLQFLFGSIGTDTDPSLRYDSVLIMFSFVSLTLNGWIYYQVISNGVSLPKVIRSLYSRSRKTFSIVLLFIVVLSLPLFTRIGNSSKLTPTSNQYVYHVHYQLAQFVRTYYSGQAVLCQDVGAIAYYGNATIYDFGLLTHVNPIDLESSAVLNLKNIHMAVVFEYMLSGMWTAQNWIWVGTWDLTSTVGMRTIVYFYAPNSTDATYLYVSLMNFSESLDSSVILTYNPALIPR